LQDHYSCPVLWQPRQLTGLGNQLSALLAFPVTLPSQTEGGI